MKKKGILFLLIALIVFTFKINFTYAAPSVEAPNAILIDYESGEILYDKNAHQVTYPASTTKILTAILTLENAELDEVVTIDYDFYVGGSSMYILKGESFTVKELLTGLLVRSANDAGEILARHISGSVEEFAKLMNQRAKELGAQNTNFTNPHGMPEDDHVSTAYDLAIMARHAMQFEVFREIVKMPTVSFEPTELTPETRYYRSSNKFLWGTGGGNQILYNGKYIDIKYEIIDGIKTGYTSQAGNCLVSSAVKDGHRLISVVLGAHSSVFSDSRSLLDYGYDSFNSIVLTDVNSLELETSVKGGVQETISLYTGDKLTKVLPEATDASNIIKDVIINENIEAPIAQGDKLGKVVYYLNGEALGEVDLIALGDVDKKSFISFPQSKLLRNTAFFITLMLLWQGFIAYLRIQKKRKRLSFGVGRSSYSYSRSLMKKR